MGGVGRLRHDPARTARGRKNQPPFDAALSPHTLLCTLSETFSGWSAESVHVLVLYGMLATVRWNLQPKATEPAPAAKTEAVPGECMPTESPRRQKARFLPRASHYCHSLAAVCVCVCVVPIAAARCHGVGVAPRHARTAPLFASQVWELMISQLWMVMGLVDASSRWLRACCVVVSLG